MSNFLFKSLYMADAWTYTMQTGCGGSENALKSPSQTACTPRRVTVLLDSRDRNVAQSPTPSSYVLKLPATLYSVTSAVLRTAEIPSSFYVFSSARGNTTLTVLVGSTTRTLMIPDGNYTFATMSTALSTALSAAFPSSTFTVSFDESSYKLELAVNNSLVIGVDTRAVNPTATPLQYGLAYYLGFPAGELRSGVGSVTGTRVVCLNPESYILVDITELNTVHQGGLFGAGGTQGTVFAKIPIFCNSFGLSVYDKHFCQNEYVTPIARLNELHVAMRFHDGSLIDFQGVEHSLTLEIMCTLTR